MNVKLSINLGSNDYPWILKDPEGRTFQSGDVCDVPDDVGELIVRRGHGVEVTPPAKIEAAKVAEDEDADATAAESPVSDTNAADAIDQISRMRSKEKLEEIVVNDPRATVQSAAQNRLDELGAS